MSTEIRKRLIIKNFKTPLDWAALAIATGGGTGLLPKMPGTWGSLATLPLAFWLNSQETGLRIGVWFFIFIVGVWAASRFDELNQTGDNQHIVIDEVLGTLITAWIAGTNWTLLWIAFGLFRLFDIVKPPPVRWIDEWSKKAAKESGKPWIGGLGVILDDVAAGIQGLIVLYFLTRFFNF